MNCTEAQGWLQRQLDGEPVAPRAALDAHLAECSSCRERFVAAERLARGLDLRRLPPAAPDLADRIVRRVQADARARRVRRLVVGLALAAGLLLAVGLLRRGGGPPVERPGRVAVRRELPLSSLQKELGEAGQAVVALTRRTADETVTRTRMLLPEVPLPAPPPVAPTAKVGPDAAEQSLRDVGRSVTSGLEPVTNSARRALSLFLRELPGGSAGPKSGS
jgi:Putative zinc-finger